jgi:hypothetical protein
MVFHVFVYPFHPVIRGSKLTPSSLHAKRHQETPPVICGASTNPKTSHKTILLMGDPCSGTGSFTPGCYLLAKPTHATYGDLMAAALLVFTIDKSRHGQGAFALWHSALSNSIARRAYAAP